MIAAGSWLWWWSGFPVAFALTCVIEVPAYLVAFHVLGWTGRGRRPPGALSRPLAVALAVGVNATSHPLLWAVGLEVSGTAALLVAEAAVVALEGFLIFVVASQAEVSSTGPRLGWSMLTACSVNALSLLVCLLAWPALVTA
jgi:hypothetical protein